MKPFQELFPVHLRRALLLAAFGAVLPVFQSAQAQQPLNLGFELPSYGTITAPRGWYFQSTDGISLDTAQVKEGRRSLRVQSSGSEVQGLNVLSTSMARGKRVTLAGWVRTNDLRNGYAGFAIAYQTRDGGAVVDSTQARGATGTTPWTRYEVTVPIDTAAQYVELMVGQHGTGTAWFDDLTLTIDGKSYTALPPVAPAATDAQVAWAKEHAIPFNTVYPDPNVHADVADLASVGTIVGDARVVELGEGTHGTRDFFQMKERMLQYLVEKMGFTTFAIEANQLATAKVEQYIRTGQGNVIDAMSGLFQVWKTEEVRELIEWIRRYNASVPAAKRINFVGYDMQDPSVPMDSVVAFLKRVDPGYADSAAAAYSNQREAWRKERYPQRSMDVRTAWQSGAERVRAHIRANLSAYSARAGHEAAAWAEQNANVVYQAASLTLAGATQSYRDSAMAANIDWVLEQHPERKVVVWAHNSHVARDAGSMGGFLARTHPHDMRVFGLATYAGQYTAAGDIVHRKYKTVTAVPGPIGSVERGLHRTDMPRFILDMRSASTSPGGEWLTEPREFRGIGFVAMDWGFAPEAVAHAFDALIFIDRTGASVQLPDSGSVPPLPAGAPKVYLDSVITLMHKALLGSKVDWPELRAEAYDRARGAKTTADTYAAIRGAISRIGDHHTFFMLPSMAANRHKQTATSNRQPVVRALDASAPPLGYVMIPAFSGDQRAEMDKYATMLQRDIARVDSAANPCGWIVDLRTNGGGNMWPMLAGIGPVLGDGVAGAFVDPSGHRGEYAYQNGKATEAGHALTQTLGTPYTLRRGPGPVAVLTSKRTASSGEAILVGFRGRPDTRTFGDTSAGFTTGNEVYSLSDGALLVLTTSVYVDRTGHQYGEVIPPDVEIPGEPAKNPGDDDAVMTAAESWLRSQGACHQ